MQNINYPDFGLLGVMETLSFIASVVFWSATGALSPGPLFFAAISHGPRSGARSGLALSIGHTLVEFPLVVLLAIGLLTVANQLIAKLSTGVVGGIALLLFGIIQIRDSLSPRFGTPRSSGLPSWNPLLIGLVLTGLNPFFVVWWFTVGLDKLILPSLSLLVFASLAGVVVMYVCHVWMDFAWLIIVAHFTRVGTNVAGTKWYRIVMMLFGPVLICFGLLGLYQAYLALSIL